MSTTTYVPIETYTVSGSSTTFITFGSGGTIPQTYTDLILVSNVKGSQNTAMQFQFNGDTTSNYSWTRMYGDGSNPYSDRASNQTTADAGDILTQWDTHIAQIQNYANTTTYKTLLNRTATSSYVFASTSLWRKTPEAITSIKVICRDGYFVAGSTFTLYGIANAAIGAPKATGGIITYDNTYYYHTFGASGTFTPQQNLTNVDYLVIAGGGGGGSSPTDGGGGGGGGAGGLRSTVAPTGGGGTAESQISLTSGTAYTITVGSGGAAQASGGTSSIAGSGLTTITSTGGGYGGSLSAIAPASGGSGGGGVYNSTTGAVGTANQGYAGGTSNGSSPYGGAGGGGAGAVGGNSTAGGASGNGGAGVAIPVIANTTGTGVATYYAGGGGGATYFGLSGAAAGTGGVGGGGLGGNNTNGTDGVVNTGSGGGGGGTKSTSGFTGGKGGSGLVVIRYAKA